MRSNHPAYCLSYECGHCPTKKKFSINFSRVFHFHLIKWIVIQRMIFFPDRSRLAINICDLGNIDSKKKSLNRLRLINKNTHTNQSMANNRVTLLTGASIAVRTTKSSTNAALGTDADDIDAAVDVNSTVTNSPKPNDMLAICAMNIDAIDIKSAVPSILMLIPIGKTNRVIRGSIPNLSFMQRNVIGSAAALRI